MKDNFEIFSENLKTLRKFYNMKQEELAQKSEIPRSSLSYYETGKSEPSLTSLVNIAGVFNIYIDDLVRMRLTNVALERGEIKRKISSDKIFISATVFSRSLKKLRAKVNLNQKELAEKIGIGKSNISFYENGTREPTLGSLIKVANFFDVTIDDLVSEEISISKFARDEIEFFKKVNFDFESSANDADILRLLCDLKKYYLKKSERLSELVKIQIPNRIKELDEIIEFVKHRYDE